jgi:predicted Zn-dependent protease
VIAAAWSLAAAFLIGIPFMARPMAEVMPPIYREQIADISWSQVNALTQYCDDSDEAADILNAMAYRMMEASNVPQRDAIWITIVDASFPNAFALPDDSIIITDDLLQMAESPDEVAGVLAHEIAHIEHDHVMTGVVRQMGAGIFFDIVFGGAGAGQAFAIASVNLTGLRYTRGDEEDADSRGLDYLDAVGIDSGGIARLFGRLQDMEHEAGVGDIPELLSSHPGHAQRAAAAAARSRAGLDPALSAAQWRIVQQACGGSVEAEPASPAQTPQQPAVPEAPQPAPPKPHPAPVEAAPRPE